MLESPSKLRLNSKGSYILFILFRRELNRRGFVCIGKNHHSSVPEAVFYSNLEWLIESERIGQFYLAKELLYQTYLHEG